MTKNRSLANPPGIEVIHDFYPYVQAVEITNIDNLRNNPFQLIAMLNQVFLNPQLEYLKSEIHYLKNIVQVINDTTAKLISIDFITELCSIDVYPNLFSLQEDLNKLIVHLEQISIKLESWDQVTVKEMQNVFPFNNPPINEFSDKVHPDPSTLSSLKEESVLGSGWTLAPSLSIAKWLKTEKQKKNKLSCQDKVEIEKQIKNYGWAGYIECYNISIDLHYVAEDENVFSALKEIMYAIMPNKVWDYIHTGKYINDNFLKKFSDTHKKYHLSITDYKIIINTDYKLINEELRKETIRQLTEEID